MVVASTGCITCRKRKIKCDETRPACLKCLKIGQDCGGYVRRHELLLKDELKAAFGESNLRPRSHGGCITCKTRKLRCDQQQPCCKRCLRASRVCHWGSRKTPSNTSKPAEIVVYTPTHLVRSPASRPDDTIDERRAIAFFQATTSPRLSGCHDGSISWFDYMLQVGETEGAIWHAVIALGALHEEFETRSGSHKANYTPLQTLSDDHLAVVQYNKAVNMVWRTTKWHSKHTPLLACLVFAAFDSLRGRPEPALFHRCSGLRILGESAIMSDHPLAGLLGCVYIHFDTENMELGIPDFSSSYLPPSPYTFLPGPIEGFTKLKDASATFEVLFNWILRSSRSPLTITGPDIGPTQQLPEVLLRYQEWTLAYDEYLRASACGLQSIEDDALSDLVILQMRRLVVRILIHVDLRYDELDFDRFYAEFKCIVTLAECFTNGLARRHLQVLGHDSETSPDPVEHSTCYGASLRAKSPTTPLTPNTYSTPRQNLFGFLSEHTPLNKYNSIDNIAVHSTQIVLSTLPLHGNLPLRQNTNGIYANSSFTLSAGIIAPLTITAFHCRHPGLRRRALRLLEATHRKEGQWDSLVCAANARAAMVAEESRAQALLRETASSGAKLVGGNSIWHAWQIPDAARLRGFEALLNEGELGADGKWFEWVAVGPDWETVVPGCTTQ